VKVYDELLDDDPENPVALAERGWLISRVDPSLVDSGLASIEKAIELDPRYAEAHFYRGMILLQSKNDAAAAAQAFETALASDPPPDLKSFLEDALQRAEEGST
jgi:tetratricopeptide (TPR) repeat protein